MTSPLLGSLAQTIGSSMSFLFLDATIERDVPGVVTDPADPPVPTTVSFACKVIEDQWSRGLLADGLVTAGDVQILILASTLSTEPLPLDRITTRGLTVTVVPASTAGRSAVTTDPARATWSCRCRR